MKISDAFGDDTLKKAFENMNVLASLPKMPELYAPPVRTSSFNRNPAEWTYERLVKYIQDFEESLDSEHEIGARLANFGGSITFHIDDIGYWGPDIIQFHGKDADGNQLQLIQNISQLSVLLIAMPKAEEQPKRIGFQLAERLEKTESEVDAN